MTMKKDAYRLSHIRHFYGDKKVLDIPDLRIETGTITGILGPNGSGKSTLLKILAFIQKPSSGHVFYNGRPEHPFSKRVRSKVTLLTQKPYLLKRSVFENVAYGLKIRRENGRLKQKTSQALELVGLDPESFAQRMWHELSGGEAQRVALAARLILKPDVLLLDEPVASVDTDSAVLIRQASLDARKELGTTLVIVSHDMQWLHSITDRQLSIYKGTLFATGMENVISGPFDRAGDHLVCRALPDGQQIRLKKPESDGSTALIRKKNIAIDLVKQADHPMLNQLDGKITSMMLEEKSGFVLAFISCCDLPFILRLTPEQVSQMSLCPGKNVTLKFQLADVEWI